MTISIVSFFLMAHSFVVSIEPARVAGLAIDDTFRVSVNVADVAHFYGYNVSITFDSLVLEAIQVTQGPFLSHFGGTIWLPPTILPGKVENAGEAMFGGNPAAQGSGTLFTVKFKVIASGSSPIHLYAPGVNLANPGSGAMAEPLPFYALLDAWYGTQSAERGSFCISDATDNQELPSVCWMQNLSKYAVVWQDRRNGSDYNIYGQRVNQNGTLDGANFSICDSAGNQLEPTLVYNPYPFISYYFTQIVWTDYRRDADSADIYGRPLGNGVPISGAATLIAGGPGFQNNPAIANCGSKNLVIWQEVRDDGGCRDTSHIRGQLLTNLGGPIGDEFLVSQPITGGDYKWNYNLSPAITAGDSAFIITWSHWNHEGAVPGVDRYYLAGRIVDTLGNQGSIINVTPIYENNYFCQSSGAFDGTNYLIVWSEWLSTGTSTSELKKIKGQFISKTGTLIGPNFTIYQASDNSDSLIQMPKVNFDGSKYLVVWDEKAGNGLDKIKGCFVLTSGTVGTPLVLCSAPYQQTFPACAQGTSSIVVWQDYRNGYDYDIWGYLGPPIGIEENEVRNPKAESQRLQVYPNPATEKINIRFTMHDARCTNVGQGFNLALKIYDATGQLVKNFSLPTSNFPLPTSVSWDGIDNQGSPVESGVYFAKCGSQTVKFLFLK